MSDILHVLKEISNVHVSYKPYKNWKNQDNIVNGVCSPQRSAPKVISKTWSPINIENTHLHFPNQPALFITCPLPF